LTQLFTADDDDDDDDDDGMYSPITESYHTHTHTDRYLQRVRIASAVLARGILSVCLSFRHVPVLCPDE